MEVKRYFSVVVLFVMLSASFMSIIPLLVESEQYAQQPRRNHVSIDLNYYDDPVTFYDYVSTHGSRDTRIMDDLDGDSVYSVEKHG